MRIISAISGTPSMSKEEVDTFLERRLNLQLGTIDEKGDPNIQPVWFDYDQDREKLLAITPRLTTYLAIPYILTQYHGLCR